MKLEIKHLAQLAASKTKCHVSGEFIRGTEYNDEPEPKVFTICGFYLDSHNDIMVQVDCDEDKWEFHISDIFPLLHPLSDLTKEIEVDGEKIYVPNYLQDDWNMDSIMGFVDRGSLLLNLTYDVVLKLIEWHFNVFSLPEELWIDINSL